MEISNILWCDNCCKSTRHEKRNPDICCCECDWVTATEHDIEGVTNDKPARHNRAEKAVGLALGPVQPIVVISANQGAQ